MSETPQPIDLTSQTLSVPKALDQIKFAAEAENLIKVLKNTPGTEFQRKRHILYGTFIDEEAGQYSLKFDGLTHNLCVVLEHATGERYLSFNFSIEPFEITLGPESAHYSANAILETIRTLIIELQSGSNVQEYIKQVAAVTKEALAATSKK